MRGNTRAGQLTCDVAGGVAFVFGSTRDLTCVFLPVNGPPERYTGEIRRFGVDLGVTGRGVIVWDVVSVGSLTPGSLAGNYVGVSANVSAGLVGLGADALIGGSNRQVALQPLALETSSGLNVAAGITELTLRAAS
ncbi:DUF992 domain-containing protein [Roseomonas sp. SXEYE002]|uniref:DUF992 domain-containing protein n=1 Tax=Roseomonas xinghualingensis TaxID=2986475 RepID=UPI0037720150